MERSRYVRYAGGRVNKAAMPGAAQVQDELEVLGFPERGTTGGRAGLGVDMTSS